jgi:hypothetical protein
MAETEEGLRTAAEIAKLARRQQVERLSVNRTTGPVGPGVVRRARSGSTTKRAPSGLIRY